MVTVLPIQPPSVLPSNMLLAVIFCVDSATYSRMGNRMEYSENNSVVFSRISAILSVGNKERRKVSDGEVCVQESMFSLV
jgi:hypothetical protein